MERTLRVRAVQPADEPALSELFASTLGECFGAVLPAEELSACALAYSADRAGQTCYVADAGGTLAGYAIVTRGASACGPVERLYVRRDLGGEREVAEALVAELCGLRTEREVTVPVSVDQGETALALYDRWGFVDVQALKRCLSMPSGHGRLMNAESVGQFY